MVSNVLKATSLLISKTIRHSDSIAVDKDLCMDINEYESILSASFDLFYCTLCYYKTLIKTLLFEQFEECFCDAFLSLKTF